MVDQGAEQVSFPRQLLLNFQLLKFCPFPFGSICTQCLQSGNLFVINYRAKFPPDPEIAAVGAVPPQINDSSLTWIIKAFTPCIVIQYNILRENVGFEIFLLIV